ncbi:hypothetical protein [Rhodopirellula europaea]|uniref:Uncharacterized protein n=1 Tax=Rhodopirellula europaea 6C TaxID=1263867 RepID=M2ABR7_9BACT|nr:hypothetical protein [Rhodopirellula europaea]EMB14205.1 hypothetical protein RE6C_05066 [Rhodopirellula europaea 6C]
METQPSVLGDGQRSATDKFNPLKESAMRPHLLSMLLVASLPFAYSGGLARADEPARLEKLPLTASDISSVTGLNIYRYRIALKPGTRFDVAVSVLDSPSSKPRFLNRQTFTSDDDVDAVDLLLSFLPRDNTLRGVLLSQDEEVAYRIDCPKCSPSGIATNIPLPLSNVRGTRKTLIPMTTDRSIEISAENEICLIAILASEDGNPASMQKSYPRAKVSVVLAD